MYMLVFVCMLLFIVRGLLSTKEASMIKGVAPIPKNGDANYAPNCYLKVLIFSFAIFKAVCRGKYNEKKVISNFVNESYRFQGSD